MCRHMTISYIFPMTCCTCFVLCPYFRLFLIKVQACQHLTHRHLQQCYRRRALMTHPDKHPGNEDRARVAFSLIQEAWETLNDHSKRAKYDADLMKQAMNQVRKAITAGRTQKVIPFTFLTTMYLGAFACTFIPLCAHPGT